MALGQRLEAALKAKGLNQTQLADMSKTGTATIQATISRDSERSKYALVWANALGISLPWLTDGVGYMDDTAPAANNKPINRSPNLATLINTLDELDQTSSLPPKLVAGLQATIDAFKSPAGPTTIRDKDIPRAFDEPDNQDS